MLWRHRAESDRFAGRCRHAGQFTLEKGSAFCHALLHAVSGLLHVLLDCLKLFELDLAADLGLDLVNVALGSSKQGAAHACELGQPLRSDHDERNHADQDDF